MLNVGYTKNHLQSLFSHFESIRGKRELMEDSA